jgi:hypothetical protein
MPLSACSTECTSVEWPWLYRCSLMAACDQDPTNVGVGSTVRIDGLKAAPELNGCSGASWNHVF